MLIPSEHLNLGRQYNKAFVILANKFFNGNRDLFHEIESPIYFCAGLAIEHYFKAFLSLKNIEFEPIHDLVALYELGPNREIKEFFNLNEDENRVLILLNERYFSSSNYGRYHLRYGSRRMLTVSPGPEVLDNLVSKMYQKFEGILT